MPTYFMNFHLMLPQDAVAIVAVVVVAGYVLSVSVVIVLEAAVMYALA